jgi:hypothetical protein
MKILFVQRYRKARLRQGGIARSGALISRHLQALGVLFQFITDIDFPDKLDADIDLVWHYAEKVDTVPFLLTFCRSHDIPFLINSNFDGRTKNAALIVERFKTWDPDTRGDVFMGVFSHFAENTPLLTQYKKQLVSIPKTIRVFDSLSAPSFSERTKICLGDVGKLLSQHRSKFGLDIEYLVKKLTEAGIPVCAYQQYDTTETPPKDLELIPKDQFNFLALLSHFRLFLHTAQMSSFEMVPLEAQSCGTPVLYQFMPQSLSQYIGQTGLMYRDVDEAIWLACRLYQDQKIWEKFSQMGVLNAQAHQISNMDGHLLLALEGLLIRFHKQRLGKQSVTTSAQGES